MKMYIVRSSESGLINGRGVVGDSVGDGNDSGGKKEV